MWLFFTYCQLIFTLPCGEHFDVEQLVHVLHFILALVQHQKSQVQKLREEANQHRVILNSLRSDVSLMEKNMIEASHVSSSFPSVSRFHDLKILCLVMMALMKTDRCSPPPPNIFAPNLNRFGFLSLSLSVSFILLRLVLILVL